MAVKKGHELQGNAKGDTYQCEKNKEKKKSKNKYCTMKHLKHLKYTIL